MGRGVPPSRSLPKGFGDPHGVPWVAHARRPQLRPAMPGVAGHDPVPGKEPRDRNGLPRRGWWRGAEGSAGRGSCPATWGEGPLRAGRCATAARDPLKTARHQGSPCSPAKNPPPPGASGGGESPPNHARATHHRDGSPTRLSTGPYATKGATSRSTRGPNVWRACAMS